MNHRARGLSGLLLLGALAAATTAGAKLYKGDVSDVRTGRSTPATVKTKGGAAALTTTIRCRPSKGCPLARRTKVRLASTGGDFHFVGTFTRKGADCSLDAYVYSLGFQGTYNCADGSAGSIGGVPASGSGGGGGGGEHPGGDY